jgi:hypothetical protein
MQLIKKVLGYSFHFLIITLKGQSHEKVGELRVCGISLGPN